ncbi:LL-diaminopimelate aminotransferase [Clostridium gasigenes]|uniref:LL-diaminopimelate aminotransferase n=1 Tax=Clostridium gasigenes TaxID=94869 RepID=UPI0014383DCF|nr:LL-diaminopimelate aminotransferase [Clostridium gasigenes]NKF05903.1 LL-diaminopimelate aminotransferase [Clostridium gasigenes]QSW19369.1 LL-diaminopimelate aminotransferase [Clostridium gasigenes]
MTKINKNYLELKDSYLFSTIATKVSEFKTKNPDKEIIRLGIGDVVLPLCSSVIDELKSAVDDMASDSTFKGYGPEQGYLFLKDSIKNYYKEFNVDLLSEEIFISDGAKSDLGNLLDIFSKDNVVVIPDPVYPVYVDTNIMDGRKINYVNGTFENGFLPMPTEDLEGDLIYICSPNNPTGATYNRSQLKEWVDFAIEKKSIILFDVAYEAFIYDDDIPHSIYEIEGAKKCAIEVCSLSKTAGFTGVRCGYTTVPLELECDNVSLNKLWLRRQTTKFNGVSYIVQKAASGVFSKEGRIKIKENIDYYMENAKIIGNALDDLNIKYIGGKNSPYIWLQCPGNMSSWEFFDYLLEEVNIVGTPGVGFGENGEGYFRLTSFGHKENIIKAVERLKTLKF